MSTRFRAAGQRRKVLGKKRPIRRIARRQPRKGAKVNATQEMITFMAPRQMPFPMRYRTKFTCELQGNIASGATGGQSGQFNVLLNNPRLPFNSSLLGGAQYANVLPAIATLNPAGLTQMLAAAMYQKCRVYSSHVQVNFAQLSQSDPLNVTISPSVTSNVPASTQVAMEQPYTKQYIFTANRSRSDLGNYITQHRLVGATKSAIENDLSLTYVASYNAAPTIPLYWVINWNVVDAANLSSAVIFTVKVTYYVELYGNYSAAMTEA